VRIGTHTGIFPGTVMRPGRITIGSGCFINHGCILDPGSASIAIGDRVAIAPRVILVGNSHEIGRPSSRAGKMVSADIRIGDGCWLGANVVVMPGVTIASGCIIGAGSIVTRDTAPDGVYVGSPARRVRTLSGQEPER
jgi:acetyltransferase-like isoleucine patch superfamily enzyme